MNLYYNFHMIKFLLINTKINIIYLLFKNFIHLEFNDHLPLFQLYVTYKYKESFNK